LFLIYNQKYFKLWHLFR